MGVELDFQFRSTDLEWGVEIDHVLESVNFEIDFALRFADFRLGFEIALGSHNMAFQ